MMATAIFLNHVPGIKEALARCGDPRSIEDVIDAIVSKNAQVWGDERALIITQLSGEYVHFWIATGEMDATLELSREILKWARGLGYTKASLTGRRGWVRALATEGWRQTAVQMEHDLG
jgi:hypothetical protein